MIRRCREHSHAEDRNLGSDGLPRDAVWTLAFGRAGVFPDRSRGGDDFPVAEQVN